MNKLAQRFLNEYNPTEEELKSFTSKEEILTATKDQFNQISYDILASLLLTERDPANAKKYRDELEKKHPYLKTNLNVKMHKA